VKIGADCRFIFLIYQISKKLAREVKVGAGGDDKQAFFVEWLNDFFTPYYFHGE
jgi:hypothetical protein